MSPDTFTPIDAQAETDRIVDFLEPRIDDKAVVLVSGGLDSDVAARLARLAVGPARLKPVTIVQDGMAQEHLDHARALADDLGVALVELDLRGLPLEVVYRLAAADHCEGFDPLGLLDPARMKCSIRTVVASAYQDRGYTVIGTSNRTEVDLGFFLPLGDGIWHVGPLAHLYKTEVRLIAAVVGTSREVLAQPPSAGFWHGQTDREDLGFWLVNEGPIHRERDFSPAEMERAEELSRRLDERDVDIVLDSLSSGIDPHSTEAGTRLGADLVGGIIAIVHHSARSKNKPLGAQLERIRQ